MEELSTERWFPVSMEANEMPDELRLTVQFVGELAEARLEAWSGRSVDTFLALARAGGLGGTVLPPRIRDALYDGRFQSWDNEAGTLVEWRIPDLQVAPEAMRVLVNLCESTMYCFDEHPILEMAVAYGQGLPAIEKLAFPDLWPDCPFEVEEYPIESSDFDVEVILTQPLTRERVLSLTDPLDYWLTAVQKGGFGGHPYAQWKQGLETNEKLLSIAGRSFILHVQQFYAQPVAFASLRNVLVAVDHAGEKIEAVVIGE